MASWSDLHPDLLQKIVHTAVDAIHVRSVCRSWRNSLPAAAVAPHQHLRLPAEEGASGKKNPPPVLIEKTIWSLQSTPRFPNQTTPGCLVQFNSAGNGRRSIGNPILQESDEHVRVSDNPWVLNFLDLRVYERDRFYVLCETEMAGRTSRACFSKALVFPSSVWSNPNNLAVLNLTLRGFNRLRLWKYGDQTWTVVQGCGNILFHDIAVFEDQFVAVDSTGVVFSINPATRQVKELLSPPQTETERIVPYSVNRLVVSGGDLYLVKRIQRQEVHKLGYDYEGGSKCWVKVNDLGSRALFWGKFSSFFIEAHEFRDCRANCIYSYNQGRDTITEFDLQQRGAPRDFALSNIIPSGELQSCEVMKFSIATYTPKCDAMSMIRTNMSRKDVYMTGFGGLLREADGRIRAMFSGKLETAIQMRSEEGKLLYMIHFAMELFYKGVWPGRKKLQLELSCSNTMGFIFSLLPFIKPYMMSEIGEVRYSCVKHADAGAVEVAKKGIDRPSFFQGWL